jgi:hypothetical protein
MAWIQLVYNRGMWRGHVNTVMSLGIPYKTRDFLPASQILSSVLCAQTYPIHVFTSKPKTNFHTNTKNVKFLFLYFSIYVLKLETGRQNVQNRIIEIVPRI